MPAALTPSTQSSGYGATRRRRATLSRRRPCAIARTSKQLQAIAKARPHAVVVVADSFLTANHARIAHAMADSRPLADTIGEYVNQQLIDEIAGEYAKGRVLLVGTAMQDARLI